MTLPEREEERSGAHEAAVPQRLLWSSLRALLPTLAFDIGGTMIVYYALLPDFPKTSILPLVGASLVPVLSNTFNFVRRRSFDIVGVIVLVGLLAGIAGALFGGSQRLVLMRESFVTGFVGLVLLVSAVRRKPLAYFVVREFLTANEAIPAERFHDLWIAPYFRRGMRVMTVAWGLLLIGEFVLRAFMAMRMDVPFVLGASPVIFTVLLLIAGAINAAWLSRALRRSLSV